jgi:osmoprotectant transport system permease protein
MDVHSAIADALALLPDYLGSHVLISFAAMALGLLVSLPLAFAALSRPRLRWILLAAASVVQTIPGLALLALFYPLMLGVAGLAARWFGYNFSALGFFPAVLALTLYSVLPILRNTVTGIAGIDPALKQAAVAVGMTRGQSLRMVELPLALPVIMAGIRTSAVWVIGTATLSTPVGQTSLGNYIFTGLQTQNWVFVLFGSLAAAALALTVDQLLAIVQRGLGARRRSLIAAAGIGLLAIILAALPAVFAHGEKPYVIGSKPFAEQYVLAALIQNRLEAAGLPTRRRDSLGSSIVFDALAGGEIDVYVEYSGTVWADVMRRTDSQPRAETLDAVRTWLLRQHGIHMLGGLGFENAYALAMKRRRAGELGIASIADLARHAPSLSIAGDYEFFGRPEWKALREAYGLAFREQRQMQPEFMYPAAGREVDVIAAYSSDGRIEQYELVTLPDPKQVIPPYDAVLLLSPARANDPRIVDALRPLIGAIDLPLIREANARAAAGAAPAKIAAWLWEQIGK